MGPPAGNAGSSVTVATNVFYPPTVDPAIAGALYWLPAFGNTGIFISNGIPGGIAKGSG
jgi:hypothetical protein